MLTTLPILSHLHDKEKGNPLLNEFLEEIGEWIESQQKPVPAYLKPFRKFDKERDQFIQCTKKEETKETETGEDLK